MNLTDHLNTTTQGARYSYAVRVRGLPYVWTDGRAAWANFNSVTPQAFISGGLLRTNWSFNFESNPLEPLNVGNGITIDLANEPSGRTARMFAPNAVVDKWEISDINSPADDTSISFQSTSGMSAGDTLYIGLETVEIVSIAAPLVNIDRALYGSLAQRNKAYYDGDSGGYENTYATSLPQVWRGRYVDVYMAEILDDNTLGDIWQVWAGRLESFDLSTKVISLKVESLTAAITKDNWPGSLGEASLGNDTIAFYLRPDDMYLVCKVTDLPTFGGGSGTRFELGVYNTGGVFTPVTTEGWYSLSQVCQLMTDTLIRAALVISSTGDFAYMYNNFNCYPEVFGDSGRVDAKIKYKNDTVISWDLMSFGPLNALQGYGIFGIDRYINTGSGTIVELLGVNAGFTIDRYASKIVCLPKDSRFYPSTDEGCEDVNNNMLAYVAVSDGENTELMSVNSIAVGNDKLVYMEIERRGLGGTIQRAWGGSDREVKPVTIKQVAAVHTGEPMSVADVLLYLLTSTDGAAGGPNGSYDILGPTMGLAIPYDLIDVEGIRAKLSISDMPQPTLFWIEDAGKGKDALENFMKLNGIYFVTRRYELAGEYRFGLSVDVVDVPAATRYNSTLGDSKIKAGTEPRVNVNERLTINHIAVSPRYEFGKDDQNTGGKRYAYAERSIKKFGRAKTLELSASVLYSGFSSRFGGHYIDEASVATAMAVASGLRWFGAFSDGNFTLFGEMPHVGWAIQAGDRINLSISNAANPSGTTGFSNTVAKVIDVKHKHGSNASAEVTLRINTTRGAELAPCFQIASYSTSFITLTDNAFSYTADGVQPPFEDDTSPPYDGQWFNWERHGSNDSLTVTIWEQGDYTTKKDYYIKSSTFSGGNWILELSSNLDAALGAAVTGGDVPVIGTFGMYADPLSSLQALYAYIGTNDRISKLGTLDGAIDDVEAFRWV